MLLSALLNGTGPKCVALIVVILLVAAPFWIAAIRQSGTGRR
jgi:hypothetical protein